MQTRFAQTSAYLPLMCLPRNAGVSLPLQTQIPAKHFSAITRLPIRSVLLFHTKKYLGASYIEYVVGKHLTAFIHTIAGRQR